MSSDKQTVDFIEDYRHYSVLWDIKDKCYTNKNKRNDAYRALGEKYKMSEKGVQSKIKNLRSYFLKEQQKMSQRKSGASANDVYQSSWFAYKHLLFLGDSITPRTTKDSLEDTITEEVEIGEDDIHDNIADEDQPPEKEAPETQDTASSSCRQQKFLPTPQTCRGIKRKIDDDGKKEEAAFGFLEVAAKSLSEKDDCSIFGEMIATQLRKLTPRNQAIARNRIQNLIFDFEMQEMNNSLQNNTVAPQYYSPSGSSSDSSYGTHYEPTISSQLQISKEKSQHPSNVLGEVQQFLCFNLDNTEK
ncbi:hypothetical protein J6590_066500 [Homalodisca vitripennis]|nr:hypothetical protein J6590_066500 [Homalodisca vitripennis]